MLDAIGLAAWKQDANMKDWQMIKSSKHLRFGLGSARVSVPYLHTNQFSWGYLQPRVKKFKHLYEDKSWEWVECQPEMDCRFVTKHEMRSIRRHTKLCICLRSYTVGEIAYKSSFTW